MEHLQPSPAGAAECSPGREPRECGPIQPPKPRRGGRIICVGEALAIIHKADRILVTHKGEIREDGDLGGGRGVGVTGPARRDASASGEQTITGGERTTAGGERTARGGERTTRGGERTTASGEQTARGGEQTTGGGERTAGVGEQTVRGGERTAGGGGRTTPAVVRPTAAGGRSAASVCAGLDKGWIWRCFPMQRRPMERLLRGRYASPGFTHQPGLAIAPWRPAPEEPHLKSPARKRRVGGPHRPRSPGGPAEGSRCYGTPGRWPYRHPSSIIQSSRMSVCSIVSPPATDRSIPVVEALFHGDRKRPTL